jgi:hypothetical protein
MSGAKTLRDYVPTQIEVGAFHCHNRENPQISNRISGAEFLDPERYY